MVLNLHQVGAKVGGDSMAKKDILVRGVDLLVADDLKERARKRGISMNEYCKQVFVNESSSEIVEEIEQRYNNLVKVVTNCIQINIDKQQEILDRLNDLEYAIKHQ